MFPNIFSIGPLTIHTYGCCMALGFLAAWQMVGWLLKQGGRKPEEFSNLLVGLMVSGVVGSRVAYVIEHWQTEFAAHPFSIIRVDQGGLMFYGGLILAILFFLGWCLKRREHFGRTADILVTAIPLAHAFGRVGCFFYGCCYGKRCDGGWGISFPGGSPASYEQFHAHQLTNAQLPSLPVLPTQLFEAAALLVLFVVLLFVYRRHFAKHPGLTTAVYLAGYAMIRFGMEFLRGDPRAAIGPFSIGQTISLALAGIGVILAICIFSHKKEGISS